MRWLEDEQDKTLRQTVMRDLIEPITMLHSQMVKTSLNPANGVMVRMSDLLLIGRGFCSTFM